MTYSAASQQGAIQVYWRNFLESLFCKASERVRANCIYWSRFLKEELDVDIQSLSSSSAEHF